MDSLSVEQRAEIDELILAGSILLAMKHIMRGCGIGLAEAREVFRARYRMLRTERGEDFSCGDEAHRSGYGEDLFDAMGRGW